MNIEKAREKVTSINPAAKVLERKDKPRFCVTVPGMNQGVEIIVSSGDAWTEAVEGFVEWEMIKQACRKVVQKDLFEE